MDNILEYISTQRAKDCIHPEGFLVEKLSDGTFNAYIFGHWANQGKNERCITLGYIAGSIRKAMDGLDKSCAEWLDKNQKKE